MTLRPGNTRDRMLHSAVTLLGQRGTAGTTVDAVLAHSGAPRGSVYHHFPGGRNELLSDAVRLAGDRIAGFIDADLEPVAALQQFAAFWKARLATTDYTAGCPVVALTVGNLEAVTDADALVAAVFRQWHDRFVQLLRGHGFPRRRADRLATLTLSAVEGAVVMCRAGRSADPLDDVIAELSLLLTPMTMDRAAGRPAAAG